MLETGEQGKTNLKEKFDSANTPPPPPPGKEPDSLNKCIWFHLKNSAQCRATQIVFYKLFTFKIIPNLQLKLCTLYVVHFLPVLDFDCVCRCCISWKFFIAIFCIFCKNDKYDIFVHVLMLED